ncbi:hypothetical protein KRP22_006864 [Phytophthora ramorum]|nr:putative threonine aspartase [Phytophthora ramorum]
MGDWLLAVHSGAGRYGSANEAAYLSVLRSALETTHRCIAAANSPLTAPQIAVKLLESFELSTLTNAGLGANLTERGRVECEASVVCGQTHLASCCGAVRGVERPSSLALKLLQQVEGGGDSNAKFAFGRQPPLVVVGDQARHLARGFGLETATENDQELERYQVTDKAQDYWDKWHRRFLESDETQEEDERLDTVGAICMDPKGNVAAALSSGGVAYKVPGRLGLAGCPRMGCDAANAVLVDKRIGRKRKRRAEKKTKNAFAVACTGRGEHFIRSNFVGRLTRRLEKAADLERGLRRTFLESSEVNGGVGAQGGVLALVSAPSETSGAEKDDTPGSSTSRTVQLGAAFTTPCMGVGFSHCRADAEPQVQIQLLRRPESRQLAGDRSRQDLSVHVSFLGLDASPG